MARIFVSYSRKNKDFCRRLTEELQKRDLDFWVDWEGIPPTVDWMNEIEKGIEEADTFIAIVSTEWILSPICIDELNIAVKNGKRLIPVVPYDIVWNDVPSTLAKLNFIFFTEAFDFNQQLDKLFTALNTDYDWLKIHRRLQVKALEWERANIENGFLLHGTDLDEAEQQLLVHATKEPFPTDLQREYILKSKQAADKQRRITTGSLISAVVVLIGIIAALLYPSIAEWFAKREARGALVPIPAGNFYMGATDPVVVETGERAEWLAHLPAFSIEKFEVTNRQYGLCVKHGNCTPPGNPTYFQAQDKQEYPVLNITVYQANAYCHWLRRRLPTELEWVRAARGSNDRRLWPWGDTPPKGELTDMPLDLNLETAGPQPVSDSISLKGASPEGVQNLIGNALEWTSTYYQQEYYVNNSKYDSTKFWHGDDTTFDGSIAFVRLGGGWQFRVYHLTQEVTESGLGTDSNTGMRCATD